MLVISKLSYPQKEDLHITSESITTTKINSLEADVVEYKLELLQACW